MTWEFEFYNFMYFLTMRTEEVSLRKPNFWEFEILGLREMNPPRPYDIYVSFNSMIIWKWIYTFFGFLSITNIKKNMYFLTLWFSSKERRNIKSCYYEHKERSPPLQILRFYDPHTIQSSDSLAYWFIVITLVTC